MYLSELELIGITIALVTAIGLIITSATANARLTRERSAWRALAIDNGYVAIRKVRELDEAQGKDTCIECATRHAKGVN